MPLVFIYGSLLPGEPNHGFLEGARFVRKGRTQRGVGLVKAGPYPSLTFAERARGERRATLADAHVSGEIYDVDDALLASLDEFEGHPDLYRRSELVLEDGTTVMAWALPAEEADAWPIVATEAWRDRRQSS